jgi:hypothetical protein
MPRIRSLKYEYFINEELAQISSEARLLGLGLTTLADREGRLEDRPTRIRVLLFPYHNVDVNSLLNELQGAHFLDRYEVDGRRYIQIINFLKHQKPHPKENPSVIPCRDQDTPRSGKVFNSGPVEKPSREKVFNNSTIEKPCRVVNGSGNGLGDLGSGDFDSSENGDFDDSVNTHTDRRLVCVPKSKFSLEEIRKFAWASHRLDQRLTNQGSAVTQGIRNPDGWAVVAHRSGEFDAIIQEWVDNPEHFEVAS